MKTRGVETVSLSVAACILRAREHECWYHLAHRKRSWLTCLWFLKIRLRITSIPRWVERCYGHKNMKVGTASLIADAHDLHARDFLECVYALPAYLDERCHWHDGLRCSNCHSFRANGYQFKFIKIYVTTIPWNFKGVLTNLLEIRSRNL